MNRIIQKRTGLMLVLLLAMRVVSSGQIQGEYRSVNSGAWDNFLNWEYFDGSGWFPAENFPDGPDHYVTIRSGHEIIYRESNAQVRDLLVESGGKLFSDGAGSYWYLVVYGDITCNGQIGNLDTLDGLCLKPEGNQCLISGNGDCRFRRIRKDYDSVAHTRIIFAMDAEVYYDGTGDAIYNNSPGTMLELEILPLRGLTLHASLDLLNGMLRIRSDSTGNGSLICTDVQHDDSTNVFLDLYMENNNDWHFIGSPVTGQPLQPEFVPDPMNNAFDFYKWDEEAGEDSGWVNIRDPSGGLNPSFETEFVMGKGYLVAYSELYSGNSERTFSGPVTTGSISIPVTHSVNHWNLVSNPYPCGLNWQSSGVDKSQLAGLAMYIWDQSLNQGIGGYLVSGLFVVPTNSMPPIVPPMNGFFVNALADHSINISPDSANTLVHAGMPLYKHAPSDEDPYLRWTLSSGGYSDEMVIAMHPEASSGYDPLLDAEKLFRIHDSVPEIAGITSQGRLLCIEAFDEVPARVPLYIISPGTHPLTLTATGQGLFPDDIGIFLIDSLMGITIDMRKEASYTFTAPAGAHGDRFYVLLDESVGIGGYTSCESVIRLQCLDGEVIIENPSGSKGRITFADVMGRIMREFPLTGETWQRIPAPSSSDVMIVTVSYPGGRTSAKMLNLFKN